MDDLSEVFDKYCAKYPYIPTILNPRKRVVVIGDLHGDYDKTICILKKCKLIDTEKEEIHWIGKDSVLVQTGDQIHRCRPTELLCSNKLATLNDEASDIKILKLFTELDKLAIEDGGRVISLLGNHELMEVFGNQTYVSYMGLKEFENYQDPISGTIINNGQKARAHAFKPGNEYAKFLACTRSSCLIIGSFLFVHAGMTSKTLTLLDINSREDLKNINNKVRMWLLGLINKDNVAKIIESSKHSIFWNRILGAIPPNINNFDYNECSKYLEPVLQVLNINGMIVGHTPQSFHNNSGINSTCKNKLFRIDTGCSSAFDKFDLGKFQELRKIQALEIINDSEFHIIS